MRHCHCCGKPAFDARRTVQCANVRDTLSNGHPVCTKVVCVDCFEEYGWDWRAACADPRWTCPHCREVCPRCAVGVNPDPAAQLAHSLEGDGVPDPATLAHAKRTAEYWALLKLIEDAEARRDGPQAGAPQSAPQLAPPAAGLAAEAQAGDDDARLAAWSSPEALGDAWGHEGGAGGVVQVRSGSGTSARVDRLVVLVGGRRLQGPASHRLVNVFDPAQRRWLQAA